LDQQVKDLCLQTIEQLKQLGAQVDRVEIPALERGIPTYYIVLPAEASTNLARFDGVRFGLQEETIKFDSMTDYYEHIRKA